MICRLCLDDLNDFVPIIDENGEGSETDIAKIIRKYFKIDLSEEENVVSNKICTNCWYQLHDFHQFWLRIEQKQETLQWQQSAIVVEEEPNGHSGVKDEPEDVKDMVLCEPQINVVSLPSFLKTENEFKYASEEFNEGNDCPSIEDNEDVKDVTKLNNSTHLTYIYDENLKELLDTWSMPQFVFDQCIKFGIQIEQLKCLDNDDVNELIPSEYLDIRASLKAALKKWKSSTQEISDYDSASSRDRRYYHLNINEVLSQSSLGQQLKRNSDKNQKLTSQQQNILVDLVIGEYFKRGINLSIKEIEMLADNLIKSFPSEKKDTYFIKRCGKTNARGKLYDKYRNLTKKFRKANLKEKFKKHEELAASKTKLPVTFPSVNKLPPTSSSFTINYDCKKSFYDLEIRNSNSSDYDSASSCDRRYYHLNINEVLSQSSLGQQLKRNSDKNQKLTSQQQNILVDLVIGEYFKRGINLSIKEIEMLADNLIKSFPSEKKDTYFIKRCGKTNARGKLYDKYTNLTKKFRKANLKEKFKKHEELAASKTKLPVTFPSVNKLPPTSSSFTINYDCKKSFYDLNINEVLSLSSLGQQLKRNLVENQKLMPKQQNILVDLVIGEYFKQGIDLSIKDIDKLADRLIRHFPLESKDTYFVRQCGKANPKGKLYDKYKNLKKKLRKMGLIESRSVHENSAEVIIPHESNF